jgi:hypothetical protein
MASRGTTFAKQERDRAKKAKAAAKREKRAEERTDEVEEAEPVDVGEGAIPAEELLALVARLHEDFDAKRIDFEEFEERKAELMARIDVT